MCPNHPVVAGLCLEETIPALFHSFIPSFLRPTFLPSCRPSSPLLSPPVTPSLWHTPHTLRGPIWSSTEGPSATARM
eukprot:6574843-Pyramimonas_sp.AAC.1